MTSIHYKAMMNDHDRNAFYRDALKAAIKPTDTVLEIGTCFGVLGGVLWRAYVLLCRV